MAKQMPSGETDMREDGYDLEDVVRALVKNEKAIEDVVEAIHDLSVNVLSLGGADGLARNMTLRQHYAGMAMQAILSDIQMLKLVKGVADARGWGFEALAIACYEAADSMLAEGAKEKKP